jgi:hypothetical protein
MAKFYLKTTKSFSKIATTAGLVIGAFFGKHHLLTVGGGILGSIIGSQILMPNDEKLLDDIKIANKDALAILKQHFSEEYLEGMNPLQTNYNMYERDNIGKMCGSISNTWHKLTKFAGIKCEKTNNLVYPNKVISTKTIIFDWFRDQDPISLLFDVIPVAIIGTSSYHKVDGYHYGEAIIDNAIIYISRPILNYITFKYDRYYDIEKLELCYNKDELKALESTDLVPAEIIESMYRCSI